MKRPPALLSLCTLLVLALALSPGLAAQTTYRAFGDSITQGVGDDPEREEQGYPVRLQEELVASGLDAQVTNHGRAGETTAEGVTRIEDVLLLGGDVLLLMEGTNDISDRISPETIRFNLEQIALKAQNLGLPTVMATVIPRLGGARTDSDNRVARELANEIRSLSWRDGRSLVDPFAVFSRTPDYATDLYIGGDDFFHPNAVGYDVIAAAFADVLLELDTVAPVPGALFPEDGATEVAEDVTVTLELFDFGAGIDIGATELLIDGEKVDPLFDGDESRLEISYQPAEPFRGQVSVGLVTADLALPSNEIELELGSFTIVGAEFLPADINQDGRVDGKDLVRFGPHFGALVGEERYRTYADFDGDGFIDGADLAILAADFGSSSL